jgi:hypothetical protein
MSGILRVEGKKKTLVVDDSRNRGLCSSFTGRGGADREVEAKWWFIKHIRAGHSIHC